jgi:hypothetical protein
MPQVQRLLDGVAMGARSENHELCLGLVAGITVATTEQF